MYLPPSTPPDQTSTRYHPPPPRYPSAKERKAPAASRLHLVTGERSGHWSNRGPSSSSSFAYFSFRWCFLSFSLFYSSFFTLFRIQDEKRYEIYIYIFLFALEITTLPGNSPFPFRPRQKLDRRFRPIRTSLLSHASSPSRYLLDDPVDSSVDACPKCDSSIGEITGVDSMRDVRFRVKASFRAEDREGGRYRPIRFPHGSKHKSLISIAK